MTATGISRPMGHNDYFPTHLAPETPRTAGDRSGARTTLSHFDDSSDEDEDDQHDDLDQDQDARFPATDSHSHIPLHPIESMQEAFAESLEEATAPGLSQKPKLRELDAKGRRGQLLDEDKSRGPPHRLWRFRPGQKCHELRKLVAQISFGVELLLKGMANSNAQVLSILQGHIDEVDEFLETAMEDVKEAIGDLNERLDFLKVPMENVEVFEHMLEDRQFRLQIVQGNVKIEHILSRTSTAHTQTIRDVSEGLRAVKQFSHYLKDNEDGPWRRTRPDVVDVFEAMKGNTEGWYNAFTALESSSTLLSGLLVRLSSMVVDIDKKAGEVSRRTRFTMEPYADHNGRSASRSLESPAHATPPPSPPTSKPDAAPRIQTLYFGDSTTTSFLDGPESPKLDPPVVPQRSKQRVTKDSDTLRNTMFAYQYTPPESSKRIPDVVVDQDAESDNESDSQSVSKSESQDSTTTSNAEDNAVYLLQPRTYTPIPPAPIPSPRVSASPRRTSTPDELSIHIEAEEDASDDDDDDDDDEERDIFMAFPQPASVKPTLVQDPHPKPLQVIKHKQSRSSDKEVATITHKSSLRDRVSLKGELPTAIHVPPVNALEFQRLHYPTPPRSRTADSAAHIEMDRNTMTDSGRHHQSHLDFSPPTFPHLIPSPASERQHFHPVQASPHSPLQQRPHTAAGTTLNRPLQHHRNAPSQMGMSMLSSVTTMTQDTAATNARTIKKKRSAFGWLKKAFSLDEEERAAFEARRRQQPVNTYQEYDGRSPRYLDGKRIA